MQIGGPGWLNGEVPIVDRPIALQKLICRVQRRDVREPHLLDHPILKSFNEPLHLPFRILSFSPGASLSSVSRRLQCFLSS